MTWKDNIQLKLSEILGKKVQISSYSYVGGGSINETFRIITNRGDFFVKKNSASKFPGMFEKEASGLSLLKKACAVATPVVVGTGKGSLDTFLILKYIDSAAEIQNFWDIFGEQIANLHKHSNNYFGLDHDNYIGSLYQKNSFHDNWCDFFREERLEFQVKMAYDNGKAGRNIIQTFERFYGKLDSIFPQEPPALLHGDLWSGNFMVNENGMPVVIDPAVYFGNREMDLGMSQLFGGFSQQFYISYNKHYPLEKGWQERLEYCNLYPLMVHVNLFGGGYIQSVETILRRF